MTPAALQNRDRLLHPAEGGLRGPRQPELRPRHPHLPLLHPRRLLRLQADERSLRHDARGQNEGGGCRRGRQVRQSGMVQDEVRDFATQFSNNTLP